MRVGIKVGKADLNWLKITYNAASVQAIMVDGLYHAFLSLGRPAWKGWMPTAPLQVNCNKEGFNNVVIIDWARVRIGILGNEQNDCGSPDSRIGLGGGGSVCNIDPNGSTGGAAGCGGDIGNFTAYGFGYVLVR